MPHTGKVIEGKDSMSDRRKRYSLAVLSKEWLCRALREKCYGH